MDIPPRWIGEPFRRINRDRSFFPFLTWFHSSLVLRWGFGILVWEMLYSTTPFKGSNRNETFRNVVHSEPSFPDHPATSTVCKSIIKKLLLKDEHKRLGSQSGASEVKQHKWFQSINFGLLRHQKPPIIPMPSSVFFFAWECSLRVGAEPDDGLVRSRPGLDAVNFRSIRESKSLDLDGQVDYKPWVSSALILFLTPQDVLWCSFGLISFTARAG